MRQVPHYLLVGNGRVARHFNHYFSLLGLSFETWNRKQPLAQLQQQLNNASHVLLLISDKAIEPFIAAHLPGYTGHCIHFSGSLVSQHAYGAHPLMCFNEGCYQLAEYQAIPFVLDHDAPSFASLLPGMPNPHVRLNTSLKAKYHALCVLSVNFSCMLWQKLFSGFEQECDIPQEMAFPILQQQMQNLLHHAESALTGPLTRGDNDTIRRNIQALSNDPFQAVYQSFVTCYRQLNEENKI